MSDCIRRWLGAAILAAALAAILGARPVSAETAYDFHFTTIDGAPLPLSEFRGKTLLVVNTASMCGFTPQYAGLKQLYDHYKDRGLVVLGVPSNDFGGQEPGGSSEIKQFCESKFDIDFPLTEKVDVIGQARHPFYRWAAETLGPGSEPEWNFHKLLVDPQGRLVSYFPSRVEPTSELLQAAVERALPKPSPQS